MVVDPADHAWSSYRHNAFGIADGLVRPHAAFAALNADPERCRAAHRRLVGQAPADEELAAIRFYLQRQQAFGTECFQQQVSAALGRRAGPGRNGRPPKLRETVL